jgi:hypothetical protein
MVLTSCLTPQDIDQVIELSQCNTEVCFRASMVQPAVCLSTHYSWTLCFYTHIIVVPASISESATEGQYSQPFIRLLVV